MLNDKFLVIKTLENYCTYYGVLDRFVFVFCWIAIVIYLWSWFAVTRKEFLAVVFIIDLF